MTDELFEEIEKLIAKKFQVKYLNPNNGEGATYDIALEYVKFVIEQYSILLHGYMNGSK